MRILNKWQFPQYARDYFGGDVQRWEFVKSGNCVYEIHQWPHWGNHRIVAKCVALTAANARREFCEMARCDDRAHA